MNPGKKDVRRAPQKQKEKKSHVQLELREGLSDDEEEGQEKKLVQEAVGNVESPLDGSSWQSVKNFLFHTSWPWIKADGQCRRNDVLKDASVRSRVM